MEQENNLNMAIIISAIVIALAIILSRLIPRIGILIGD